MIRLSAKNRIQKPENEKSFVEDKNPTSTFNDSLIQRYPVVNSVKKLKKIDKSKKKLSKKINSFKDDEIDIDQFKDEDKSTIQQRLVVNKLTDDKDSMKKSKKIRKLKKKLSKKILNSSKTGLESEEIDIDQVNDEDTSTIKKKKLKNKIKRENVDDEEPSKKKLKKNDVDETEPKKKKKLKEIPEIEEKRKIEWQPKRPHEWWIQMPDQEIYEETQRRLRDQDSRSIYFTYKSKTIKEEDLRALSPDIQFIKWRPFAHVSCGWIFYENNEISKINLEKLKETTINDAELKVRHCLYYEDEKPKADLDRERMINTLKLDISGLLPSTTQKDLERAFPSASAYYRDPKKMPTNAYALFDTPEIARQAFLSGKDMIMNGVKLTVLYCRPSKNERGKVQSFMGYQQKRRFRPPMKKWRGYVGDY